MKPRHLTTLEVIKSLMFEIFSEQAAHMQMCAQVYVQVLKIQQEVGGVTGTLIG